MKSEWDSLIHHQEHNVEYKGLKIVVWDGVFTPDQNLTYSSTQTLEYLEDIDIQGKDILDMGCGTGIIGIACLIKGANKVTFTDVNQRSIENTVFNLKENNLFSNKVDVVTSDLFKEVSGNFDIIFANLPISNELWVPEINENTEGLLVNFLRDIPHFIKEKGRVIINWGSFADLNEVTATLKKFGYPYTLVTQRKLGHDWYIIDIQFN